MGHIRTKNQKLISRRMPASLSYIAMPLAPRPVHVNERIKRLGASDPKRSRLKPIPLRWAFRSLCLIWVALRG